MTIKNVTNHSRRYLAMILLPYRYLFLHRDAMPALIQVRSDRANPLPPSIASGNLAGAVDWPALAIPVVRI